MALSDGVLQDAILSAFRGLESDQARSKDGTVFDPIPSLAASLAKAISNYVRSADVKGSDFSVVGGQVIVQVTGNAAGVPNTPKAVKLQETKTLGEMN